MRSISGVSWGAVLGLAVVSSVGGTAQAEPQANDEAVEVEEEQSVKESADLDDPVPAPVADAPKQLAAPPTAATSHATLRFRNDVGDKYTLVEVRFQMDGKVISPVLTNPERGKGYVVFDGPAPAGRHVVTAHLTYQGRSRGIFTYTKGYTFKVTADQVLTTPANRTVGFTVVGKEVKGLNAPVERRIAVTVEENAGSKS